MAFACRICKEKFNISRLLTEPNAVSEGYSVVSGQCGHLFHSKCLEGALTNQKLLHMRHGTGPLRRFCPVAKCNTGILSDESIIPINLTEDVCLGDESDSRDGKNEEEKLIKKIQTLLSEKDRLMEGLQRSENECEMFRSALEEIKFDLSEIQSFVKDDNLMKKGDLIFWVTKEGLYAPGKVLEIRKKPGEDGHYAIVKLDNKTRISGLGPHASNRDTLMLPVSDLLTYKSFFSEYFDKFQTRFESLMVDLNWEIQELSFPTSSNSQSSADRSAAYYRSTRKLSKSASKSSIGLNNLDELGSSTSVDSIAVQAVRRYSQPLPPTSGIGMGKKVARSRTVHYGEGRRPRRLEKCRSKSWANPPTRPLDSPNETLELEYEMRQSLQKINGVGSETDLNLVYESEEDAPKEFFAEGERVIWYDNYSEFQQVGTVAAVCEYSPCAIVHFDEHPHVKNKFQYRTVPLNELFPYDLASAEDKLKIAEMYGKIIEFVDSRQHIFSDDGSTSGSENEEFVDADSEGIQVDSSGPNYV